MSSESDTLGAILAILAVGCVGHTEPPSAPPSPQPVPAASPPATITTPPDAAGAMATDPAPIPSGGVPSAKRDGDSGVASVPHGGLEPEAIRNVVLSHRGALMACYQQKSREDPTLRGGLTVIWGVDEGGVVTDAQIVRSTIHNE